MPYNSKGQRRSMLFIISLYQIKMLYNRKGEVYHLLFHMENSLEGKRGSIL